MKHRGKALDRSQLTTRIMEIVHVEMANDMPLTSNRHISEKVGVSRFIVGGIIAANLSEGLRTTRRKRLLASNLQKARESLTPEERIEKARKANASLSLQQRRERAEKARRAAGQHRLSDLEWKFRALMLQEGLYAEEQIAEEEDFFYCGNANQHAAYFPKYDRFKFPDFKMKGRKLVVEIHGSYWHRQDGKRLKYQWDDEELRECYQEAGYVVVILREDDLKDEYQVQSLFRTLKRVAESLPSD